MKAFPFLHQLHLFLERSDFIRIICAQPTSSLAFSDVTNLFPVLLPPPKPLPTFSTVTNSCSLRQEHFQQLDCRALSSRSGVLLGVWFTGWCLRRFWSISMVAAAGLSRKQHPGVKVSRTPLIDVVIKCLTWSVYHLLEWTIKYEG